ncbi:hypothetical protein AMECASPLE_037464 [Ameca splendens]|uniref:Uncharacterized protein n=1 Tax=Ameca splendens TaxID=208324 RepID=A0ABV0ZTR9_9TELE
MGTQPRGQQRNVSKGLLLWITTPGFEPGRISGESGSSLEGERIRLLMSRQGKLSESLLVELTGAVTGTSGRVRVLPRSWDRQWVDVRVQQVLQFPSKEESSLRSRE